MLIKNYECTGQIGIFDLMTENVYQNVAIKDLTQGQYVFRVLKGDIKELVATGEKWQTSDGSVCYRLMSLGKNDRTYDVAKSEELNTSVFVCKNDAAIMAESYLLQHDVIKADKIKPVNVIAYSYVRSCDQRNMISFYSELENGMVYIKGFMTYDHLILEKNKKKFLKLFMEQQEFKYENPKEIMYLPCYKNMYKTSELSDWDYAEAAYTYAIG